ncbi:MAG: sigma-70 family RNA polymerase sigma factor [Bdellovibrionota bacterium]
MSDVFSTEIFILKIRAKDPLALSQLVEAYTDKLYRCCLGMGLNEEAAADCTQSTWLTFLDVAHKFEARSKVQTYLFGILYNKIHDQFRNKQKMDKNDPIDNHMNNRFDNTGHWIQSPIDPESFLLTANTKEEIENCLEKLPDIQRMAFAMREIDEECSKDICKILEITETNLNVLLYRARNRLRECIEKKAVVI